jgi:hypothetical protein
VGARALLALAVVLGPGELPSVRARVTQVVEESAKEVAKGTSWRPRVSPPFPLAWPPDGGGAVDYYAFAFSFDPRLADGERLGAPWARVRVEGRSGDPRLEILTRRIEDRGIQGVRPLSKQEAAVLRDTAAMEEKLLGILVSRQRWPIAADDVREYYCLWVGLNAVARDIRPRHEAFFAWLDCR